MAGDVVNLAGLMEEVGPGADVEQLLGRMPAPSDQAIAEAAGLLARRPDAWDAEKVGESLRKASSPSLAKVAGALRDGALSAVADEAGLRALTGVWRGLSAAGAALPGSVFLGATWRRPEAQAAALRLALAAPPGLVDWSAGGAQAVQPTLAEVPAGSPWLRRDMYEALAGLARAGLARDALAALEQPARAWPELVARGVAGVRDGWGPDLAGLLPRLLDGTPAPACLDVAARAASDGRLPSLEGWLAAAVAARGPDLLQDCLTYLEARLRPGGAPDAPPGPVLAAFFGVLALHAHALPPAALTLLERVRRAAAESSPALAAALQRQQQQYDAAPPRGADGEPAPAGFGEDVEAEANATFQRVYTGALSVSELVEDLQRMAAGGGDGDALAARRRRLFDCVVHNLFDEYRFLPRYPERELELTAELWGTVIAQGLVTGGALAVALRSVLDALERHPPGSKMHAFGLSAARQTRPLLRQWPEFAARLAAAPGVDAALREAAAIAVREGAESGDSGGGIGGAGNSAVPSTPDGKGATATARGAATPAHASSQPPTQQQAMSTPLRAPRGDSAAASATTPAPSAAPTFASTVNADSLEAAVARDVDYPSPPPAAMDRIHFLVNNLTRTNVTEKLPELRSLVPAELTPWFVTYVTVKRAAQEPNFHDAYVALIDAWGDRALWRSFVRAAIKYSKVILDSTAAAQFSDRALLRHLGSFLGKLTLAKNRPVLQRDLDLREVILSAYETGRLHIAFLYVRYLLEPGAAGRVFRPPNPWFMSVLRLLAEVYRLPGLRSALIFEVELICKTAGVAISDVPSTDLLRHRRPPPADSPDFSPAGAGSSAASAGLATPDRSLFSGGGAGSSFGAGSLRGAATPVARSGVATPTPRSLAPTHTLGGQALAPGALGTPPPPPPPPPPGAYSAASPAPGAPGAQLASPAASSVPSSAGGPPPALPADAVPLMEQLAPRLVVPKALERLERLGLRQVLLAAAERAVREILEPVVERARGISCVTARALALKDHAAEPDAERVRRAAALCARGLAGSLALVTAREPLRARLRAHLAAALPHELDAAALDELAQDNAAVACGVIEGVAAARAAADVDARISGALAARRAAAAAGVAWEATGDGGSGAGAFPAALPASLRPAPGRGRAAEVYEEFARVPLAMVGAGGGEADSSGGGLISQQQPQPQQQPATTLRLRFAAWVSRVDAAVASEASGGAAASSAVPAPLARDAELRAVAAEAALLAPAADVAAIVEVSRAVLARALVGPPAGAGAAVARAHAAAHVAALEALRGALGGEGVGAGSATATTDLQPPPPNVALLRAELTRLFLAAVVEEGRAAREVGELLALARLLSLPELDVGLARALGAGGSRAGVAGDLALGLLQAACHCCGAVTAGGRAGLIGGNAGVATAATANGAARAATPPPSSSQRAGQTSAPQAPATPGGTRRAGTPPGGDGALAASSPTALSSSTNTPPPAITAHDLAACAEALSRLAARLPQGAGVLALVAEARRLALLVSAGPKGPGLPGVAGLARDGPRDAPAVVEATMKALDRWVRVLQGELAPGPAPSAARAAFFAEARASGLVGADGALAPAAARVATQLAVQHALRAEVAAASNGVTGRPTLGFQAVDALVRLVAALARGEAGEGGAAMASSHTVLPDFLAVLSGVLTKDADDREASFNGRPYFRLILGLMAELLPEADALEDEGRDDDAGGRRLAVASARARALAAFLFTVRPQRVPAFGFAWLQLVGERRFLPVLLTADGAARADAAPERRPGDAALLQLLLAQLAFLEPALRAGEQTEAARQLLRGTLRVLLVILHDFSGFLCRNATALAAAVPPRLLQMRNLILSAFPRGLALPDPFSAGLAGADMPGGGRLPPGAPAPDALLPPALRAVADKALGPGAAVTDALVARLLAAAGDSVARGPEDGTGSKDPASPLSIPRAGDAAPFRSMRQAAAALAVYICLRQATEAALGEDGAGAEPGARAPARALPSARDVEVLAALLRALDPPTRAAAMAALTDQLRFPSAHTAAASAAVLGVFARAQAADEAALEQLTRVMLERLIATRPHPWGLLVTFIELLKNARYGFRAHEFTRCAPDIERLFDSLSRSAGSGAGSS